MVYMAKDIKENRVVKIKNMAQPSKEDRVVKNTTAQQSPSKWAGIPMDEEGKKRFRQTWEEIDSCLKTLKKIY